MYFCLGCPRTFAVQDDAEVVAAAFSPPSVPHLLAVLTRSSVHVWSARQHRVRLASITTSEERLTKHGANRLVCWRPDGEALAVVVGSSRVVFYDVAVSGEAHEWVPFPPKTQHSLHIHVPHVTISTRKSIRFGRRETFISCVTTDSRKLMLGLGNGYVIPLLWTGDVRERVDLYAALPSTDKDVSERTGPLNGSSPSARSPSGSEQGDPLVVGPEEKLSTGELGSTSGGEGTDNASEASGSSNGDIGLLDLQYSSELKLLGAVFSHGCAAVVSLDPHHDRTASQRKGHWLALRDATKISINSKYHLASVGLTTGDVHLYNLMGDYSLARRLTLSVWGFLPEDTGPVNVLAWTPDDAALGVGWQNRGMALWSARGCRLMSTLPQIRGGTPALRLARPAEPLQGGVRDLTWGPEGYHLVVVPNRPLARCASQTFVQFSFVKSAQARCQSQHHSNRMVLQGEDRVMVVDDRMHEQQNWDWEHVLIPEAYLATNWPIKFTALSADRSHLAVAGKRGTILYNLRSKRWRFFGDVNQEQGVVSRGLMWFQDMVVIVHYDLHNQYALLLYPHNHLDQSSLLHREVLAQKPILMDEHGNYLAICTNDAVMSLYRADICRGDNPSVSLQKLYQYSLSTLPRPHPVAFRLVPVSISATATDASLEQPFGTVGHEHPHKFLVLQPNGLFVLLDFHSMREVGLASSVEQFWFNTAVENVGQSLVWAYGEHGLQVWFAAAENDHDMRTRTNRDTLFDFDPEVYPMGMVEERGVVLGMTQSVSHTSPSEPPCYLIRTETQPFLHCILRHWMACDRDDLAEKTARRFSNVPHFCHSLELLLHAELEDCYAQQGSPSESGTSPHPSPRHSSPRFHPHQPHSPLLSRIVSLIRLFPEFLDVIVQCARKTDCSQWGALFAEVGDLQALWQECFDEGRLRTAASYLLILKNIDGPAVSSELGVTLLKAALAQDELGLAYELTRFLRPFDDDEMVDDGPFQVLGRSRTKLTEARRVELSALMEKYLFGYAQKLLQAGRLRQLITFIRKMDLPLLPWLSNERLGCARVRDFSWALRCVVEQFRLNTPPSLDFPPKISLDLESSPSLGDGRRYPVKIVPVVSSPVPLSPAVTHKHSEEQILERIQRQHAVDGERPEHQDLRILLSALRSARCYEWLLVLGVATGDVRLIEKILRTSPGNWQAFREMLLLQDDPCYTPLLSYLEGHLDFVHISRLAQP